MRHTRLLVVAIAVILLASVFGLVPGSARASPSMAVAHPAASDTIRAVDLYGYAPGSFYVGLGYGNVYFTATDGVDAKATVEINDQNATRDGLVNPVATFTPTFGTFGYNYSYLAPTFYQLPLGLLLGGWWNITINGTNAGFASSAFFVHTYVVQVSSGGPAYLPSHTGEMFYFVNASVNNAPATGLTSIEVTGQYETTADVIQNLPGTPEALTTASQGSFNFTVPSNANTYSDLYFRVFANVSGASGVYSESSVGAAPVGYVATPELYLGDCASVRDCQTAFFTSGEIAFALVQAYIYTPNGTAPAPGLATKFQFDSGVLPVTPAGDYPQNLSTNGSGAAEILFNASATTFTPSQTAALNVSLTDPLNAASLYGPVTVTFHVALATPVYPGFLVQFGSDQYFAGDTAVVNWWFGGVNATSTHGWTISSWTVWQVNPDTGSSTLLGWQSIDLTTTSGTFSEAVPLGSSGYLLAQVDAYNATGWTDSFGEVSVTAPSLLVNPSEYYFLPGNTVTVTISPQGQALASAVFFETVTASDDLQLSNGQFTGTQFSFAIPALLSAESITISVSAQTAANGVIAATQTSIYQGTGLYVTGGVQTVSNYADGSFQPGQTITITYQVFAQGNAVIPRTFWIDFYPGSVFFYGGTGLIQFQTNSPSGSFQYTIPSNTPAGVVQFFLYVDDQYCSGNCYPGNSFGVAVEPSPSVLGYELGAGSGITVGWLILLVIILVVGVLVLLVARRKGGAPGGSRGAVAPYSSSPAAASPSGSPTPPPSAYQETPSSGSSSPPPLPPPSNSS
jgi:hypothetical protein